MKTKTFGDLKNGQSVYLLNTEFMECGNVTEIIKRVNVIEISDANRKDKIHVSDKINHSFSIFPCSTQSKFCYYDNIIFTTKKEALNFLLMSITINQKKLARFEKQVKRELNK